MAVVVVKAGAEIETFSPYNIDGGATRRPNALFFSI